jgi:hypothetical protein
MRWVRQVATRSVGAALSVAGWALLVLGAAIGWVIPAVPGALSAGPLSILRHPAASTHVDVGSYLGADITALAVIIAVVIGFNITILQIAGQAHSLNLARGILSTMTPFLICWSVTTGVALVYFLVPPTHVGQLWQLLAWFAAVVLLMIAYLWDLPWRLSGEYVVRWALRGLRGRPVAEWETVEGYSVVQNAMVSAGVRGDIATARAIALALGRFLVQYRDGKAEAANTYNRRRYRSLKTLLSGSAQSAAQAPNAVAYYLGYIQAGVLLQAVAGGHPTDDEQHDLFTGLVGSMRGGPERINALWTGLRHALCRPTDGSTPFLLDYWLGHGSWPLDDPRRVTRLAVALERLHAACCRELRSGEALDGDSAQASEMAIDLFRDIAEYLAPAVERAKHRTSALRLPDLPVTLLDDVQAGLMRGWREVTAEAAARVEVVNAYERYRQRLGNGVMRAAV